MGQGEGLARLGGLYIIVRSFSNIGKAFPPTPYDEAWRVY